MKQLDGRDAHESLHPRSGSSRRNLRCVDLGDRSVDVLLTEHMALELASEVCLVGGHVEVAVPAEVEENHAFGAFLLGAISLPDR